MWVYISLFFSTAHLEKYTMHHTHISSGSHCLLLALSIITHIIGSFLSTLHHWTPSLPTCSCCAPASKTSVWYVVALTVACFSCLAAKRMACRRLLCKSWKELQWGYAAGAPWVQFSKGARQKEEIWICTQLHGNHSGKFIFKTTEQAQSEYCPFRNKGKYQNVCN